MAIVCKHCEKPFKPRRRDQRFCSRACKCDAYTISHKEQIALRKQKKYDEELPSRRFYGREKMRSYKANDELWSFKKRCREFGIDLDKALMALAVQHSICAVKGCGAGLVHTGPKNNRIHFDHDHVTGKFRGFICHKCNMALGMVEDSADRLRGLIQYLKDHGSETPKLWSVTNGYSTNVDDKPTN